MKLMDSTHDDALNRAAWGSITSSGQFPPPPKGMKDPNLKLRVTYLYNEPLQ
jgi:outer membrane biosynthesis protein TonB